MLGQIRGSIQSTPHLAGSIESKQASASRHPERVKNYIDKDIPPDSALSRLDFEAMPELVSWANKNYPGLSLHHAATPYELAEQLKELSPRGETLLVLLVILRQGECTIVPSIINSLTASIP